MKKRNYLYHFFGVNLQQDSIQKQTQKKEESEKLSAVTGIQVIKIL